MEMDMEREIKQTRTKARKLKFGGNFVIKLGWWVKLEWRVPRGLRFPKYRWVRQGWPTRGGADGTSCRRPPLPLPESLSASVSATFSLQLTVSFLTYENRYEKGANLGHNVIKSGKRRSGGYRSERKSGSGTHWGQEEKRRKREENGGDLGESYIRGLECSQKQFSVNQVGIYRKYHTSITIWERREGTRMMSGPVPESKEEEIMGGGIIGWLKMSSQGFSMKMMIASNLSRFCHRSMRSTSFWSRFPL